MEGKQVNILESVPVPLQCLPNGHSDYGWIEKYLGRMKREDSTAACRAKVTITKGCVTDAAKGWLITAQGPSVGLKREQLAIRKVEVGRVLRHTNVWETFNMRCWKSHLSTLRMLPFLATIGRFMLKKSDVNVCCSAGRGKMGGKPWWTGAAPPGCGRQG